MTGRTQHKLGTLLAALFESKMTFEYGISDETQLDKITTRHLSTLCRELAQDIPSIYNHVANMIWRFLEDVSENSETDVYRFAIVENGCVINYYFGQLMHYDPQTNIASFAYVYDDNGNYISDTFEWSLVESMRNCTKEFDDLIEYLSDDDDYWGWRNFDEDESSNDEFDW